VTSYIYLMVKKKEKHHNYSLKLEKKTSSQRTL
jgi:hypothetical protein